MIVQNWMQNLAAPTRRRMSEGGWSRWGIFTEFRFLVRPVRATRV